MDTNKQIQTTKQNLEQIKRLRLQFDPDIILERTVKEPIIEGFKAEPGSDLYRAVTLLEFNNGTLMTSALSNQYKTLAIYLSRQLQAEYDCKTVIEKATAELVAINYCRTLEIQRRMNNLLNKDGLNRIELEFLSILSKELDRANRHYLSASQTLKAIRQPQLQFNIKTDTAILGNNQLIQENKHG